ncbi:MAG: PRC-barrel domain-containing protein [Rhizobiaceae bacterium]|nr:PRC-barrel domain-containing protein [Rhizobiaceae bacterium]
MKQKLVKIFAALALTASTLGFALPAHADDTSFDQRIEMAYAPIDEEVSDQQFEQFELHGNYEDAHELNDAWLGMPVRDAAGDVIGYVEDAFLDEDGYLDELLVSINGSSATVYVDQKHVEYTDVAVLVDLPVRTIASLEQAEISQVE